MSMTPRIAALWALLVSTSLGLRAADTPAPAAESVPKPETAPSPLSVFPPDVNLGTSRDRQAVIVQLLEADGITRDVTAEAKLTLEAPLAKLDGNVLQPLADGETKLVVEHGGKSVAIPVRVKDAAAERPISFKLDVMPIFARAGCNSGSCHGAARGKDGFRLSLFGYDPDGDYHRLTREVAGRRINLALIHESLLLEKATGKVAHTGGKRFDGESELYATLTRWLDAGAPQDPPDLPKLTGVDLYPPGGVLDGEGAEQRMVLRARYSDGTDRDVTSLAYFLTNNETSAAVAPGGLVKAGARGEAFVMARFETFTVGSHFIVLPKGLQFAFPEVPENNYIDALVWKKLQKLRIAPSELSSDEVFLRDRKSVV